MIPRSIRPSPRENQPDNLCWVELFGPARLLAGVKEIAVPVDAPVPIRGLIPALATQCPALAGPVLDVERKSLTAGYIFNRNGRDFLDSPDALVHPGDRILLLSSAAGG